MQRGNGIVIFFVVAALIAVMGGLNYMQSISNPTDQERTNQQLAKTQAAQAKAGNPSPHTPPELPHKMHPYVKRPFVIPGLDSTPPDDVTLGKAGGTPIITVGYTWDSSTAASDTQLLKVVDAVEVWSKTHPGETVKIVCLDLPQSQLTDASDSSIPLGLAIGGKTVSGCDVNPGDANFDTSLMQTLLTGVK